MKLTEQHVSEEWLNKQIAVKELIIKLFEYGEYLQDDLNALLELKQRRSEDRKHDFLSQALNEGDGVYRP